MKQIDLPIYRRKIGSGAVLPWSEIADAAELKKVRGLSKIKIEDTMLREFSVIRTENHPASKIWSIKFTL